MAPGPRFSTLNPSVRFLSGHGTTLHIEAVLYDHPISRNLQRSSNIKCLIGSSLYTDTQLYLWVSLTLTPKEYMFSTMDK